MADENPILNNPYEEPEWHYATNLAGEPDYSNPVKGRRIFTPEIQNIPVRQGPQAELMELNEAVGAEFGNHVVNLLRREVAAWRNEKYPQTTRITRELLGFWFLNPERDMTQSLFFAQREAIETAIWLNEVAEKSNVGQHILRTLQSAQSDSSSAENHLPRVAFKMATGTGKTVVMAALIAYHYFNRAEYRNDARFADNFRFIREVCTFHRKSRYALGRWKRNYCTRFLVCLRVIVPPGRRLDTAACTWRSNPGPSFMFAPDAGNVT